MESISSAPIRICISFIPQIASPVDERQMDPTFVTNQIPEVKGPIADAVNIVRDMLFDGSFNYSFINTKGGFGIIKEDGSLTGCLNSLKHNLSDISFVMGDIPIPDESIGILGIVGDSCPDPRIC